MSEETTRGAVSDYEIIGGGHAVSAVVNDFYERVLATPSLRRTSKRSTLRRRMTTTVMAVSRSRTRSDAKSARLTGRVGRGPVIGPGLPKLGEPQGRRS
jgi:hypothetical protein